jgi:hypothetical protein
MAKAYYWVLNEDQEYVFMVDGEEKYLEYRDCSYVEPLAGIPTPQLSLDAEKNGKAVSKSKFLEIIGAWSKIVLDHLSPPTTQPTKKITKITLHFDGGYLDISTNTGTWPYYVKIYHSSVTHSIPGNINMCREYIKDVAKVDVSPTFFKQL